MGGKLVGVLKVETKMKQVKAGEEEFTYFSEQDELVFEFIANSAAIAIENARLQESRRLAEQIRREPQNLLRDLHIVEDAREDFSVVLNPYVAGPPIKPGTENPFFGRKDIFDWVAENLQGAHQQNILVLHGERRMGKTSILLQLEHGGNSLRESSRHPICPVFVNLQSLTDTGTHFFLHGISECIGVRGNEYSVGTIDVFI